MGMAISPWHQTLWHSLQERRQVIPSSTLLVGRPGTDLPNLGMELAGMLLCDVGTSDKPCTSCRSCHMFERGVHPDLHVISTEEAEGICDLRFKNQSMRYTDTDSTKRERRTTVRSIITVDQIRAVTESLNKSDGLGSSKVCLIYPADALNLNAANALLKSLEEPTGGSYFLLLSSFPGNLPPTIRSRCSRLDLNNPTIDESIEWLTTEHKVDLKVAQQLITCGLGPYEVLQMNTREDLEAYQALIDGLTGLISGSVNAGAFARHNGVYDTVLTLKVIQSEIYRGLRESVHPRHHADVPVLISPDLALEFREVLFSVYFAIGKFLSWPKKSVDEQLFLEHIALKLSFAHNHGHNT